MAVTGKTGADAIWKALKRIVIVLSHYAPKLLATVAIMQAGGQLTSAEAAEITAFINDTASLLAAITKVADYSGF